MNLSNISVNAQSSIRIAGRVFMELVGALNSKIQVELKLG